MPRKWPALDTNHEWGFYSLWEVYDATKNQHGYKRMLKFILLLPKWDLHSLISENQRNFIESHGLKHENAHTNQKHFYMY